MADLKYKDIRGKIIGTFFEVSVKSINQCKSVIQTSYDIVKAHAGELKIETLSAEAATQAGKEGKGAEFIIILPV